MARKVRLRCSNRWDPVVCVALCIGDIDVLLCRLYVNRREDWYNSIVLEGVIVVMVMHKERTFPNLRTSKVYL